MSEVEHYRALWMESGEERRKLCADLGATSQELVDARAEVERLKAERDAAAPIEESDVHAYAVRLYRAGKRSLTCAVCEGTFIDENEQPRCGDCPAPEYEDEGFEPLGVVLDAAPPSVKEAAEREP